MAARAAQPLLKLAVLEAVKDEFSNSTLRLLRRLLSNCTLDLWERPMTDPNINAYDFLNAVWQGVNLLNNCRKRKKRFLLVHASYIICTSWHVLEAIVFRVKPGKFTKTKSCEVLFYFLSTLTKNASDLEARSRMQLFLYYMESWSW